MRIISVNVGGMLAAVEQGVLAWLAVQNADVICIQDTRTVVSNLAEPRLQLPGYVAYANAAEVPRQGGVVLYTKVMPKAVILETGLSSIDPFGRYLQVDFDKVSIATLLLPSGQEDARALQQKQQCMEELLDFFTRQRRKRREYIYCASLFMAHQKIDVKNWRDAQQITGFLPAERSFMESLLGSLEYVDAVREINRESELFSWWPDTEQAQLLDLGARFDYQLLTPGLRRLVRTMEMPKQPRWSAHAPVVVDYDWTLSL